MLWPIMPYLSFPYYHTFCQTWHSALTSSCFLSHTRSAGRLCGASCISMGSETCLGRTHFHPCSYIIEPLCTAHWVMLVTVINNSSEHNYCVWEKPTESWSCEPVINSSYASEAKAKKLVTLIIHMLSTCILDQFLQTTNREANMKSQWLSSSPMCSLHGTSPWEVPTNCS